ncbi:MAG: hypothetical protein ACTHLW_01020 [Verrucomicrobiota bacterium]
MKFVTSDKPLTSTTARNCFIVNQFATPGLGSVMGGRFVAGVGQILLAIVGFLLVIAWFALTINESYKLMDSVGEPKSYTWLGIIGGIAFSASWLWALVSSIQLFREARRNETGAPPPIPKKF